jgi:hypothetical protein
MNIFKSKTITTASVLAAVGTAQAFVPAVQVLLTPFLTPEAMGLLMVVVAGVFAFLRSVTVKPLSEAIAAAATAVVDAEKANTSK